MELWRCISIGRKRYWYKDSNNCW